MLRIFNSFWLSFADKVATGRYNIVTFIVKIRLSGLTFVLSLPTAVKTQYFVHLSFNSTLQLINCISSDMQKFPKYFNSTAIVAIFWIPLAVFGLGWASVFPNNLVLYLKDLKSSVFAILLLKSVAWCFE